MKESSTLCMHETQLTLLTTEGLCRELKVSRNWIYRRTRQNALDPLPCIRLGRCLRFKQAEVEAYIKSRRAVDSGDMLAATDGIARVNKRRYQSMARRRFQKGHVRLSKTEDPCWEGYYREPVLLPDGRIFQKPRYVNLGRRKDVPTKKLAQRELDKIIAKINDLDYRPRAILTVRDSVEKHYL